MATPCVGARATSGSVSRGGSVSVGEQILMGSDVAPEDNEKPKGFSLSLQMRNTTQAERLFHLLAKDGTVVMPHKKTFWAARFGMVVDRFGIPWLINCEGSDQSPVQRL